MSDSATPHKEAISKSTPSEQPGVLVAKRHHLLVRWSHWLNVPILLGLILSGISIYWASPIYQHKPDPLTRNFDVASDIGIWICAQGYVYITQLAVKQMLAQKTGGSITGITSAMVEHPIAGINCSVPMITKGGLEAITRSLAMEYAKDGIRFNAVAPGIVDTPMHANAPGEFLKACRPWE